jgi:hypothetical protein
MIEEIQDRSEISEQLMKERNRLNLIIEQESSMDAMFESSQRKHTISQ